jgi:hypothetical protein
MHGAEIDTTLIQFSGENWFQLWQYVTSQNNRFLVLIHWHLASGIQCDAQKHQMAG